MKYRKLGDSELKISVLAMGTWAIGGKDFGPVYDSDSHKAIFRALDLGVNLFDTAPLYGNGHAEEVLGKAFEGMRDQVMIATKVGPDEPMPGVLSVNLTPKSIREQLVASLKRLRTDYVDLLQIHWWDDRFNLPDAIHAMQTLKQEGLTREIGVSNFNLNLMKQVAEIGGVASLQSPCNMLDCPERCRLLNFCRENGIGALAYSPLARGLLTGKFKGPAKFHEWDIRRRDPAFSGDRLSKNLAFIQEVQRIANSIGLSLPEVALAWVIAQPGMSAAIFGARSAIQVGVNVKAADVSLGKDVLAEIEAIRRKYFEVDNEGCMD